MRARVMVLCVAMITLGSVVPSWAQEPVCRGAQLPREGLTRAQTLEQLVTPEVVARFAPRLRFDMRERDYPWDADDFLAQCRLGFRDADGSLLEVAPRGHIDGRRLGEGDYAVDVAQDGRAITVNSDDLTRPNDAANVLGQGQRMGFVLDAACVRDDAIRPWPRPAPMYWRFGGEESRARFGPTTGVLVWIEYWFFYAYNDAHGPLGNHEGDWEGVCALVELPGDGCGGVDTLGTLRGLVCSQHAWSVYEDAPHLDVVAGTHATVYPGRGTHATFPHSGRNTYYPSWKGVFFAVPFTDYADGRGGVWDGWRSELRCVDEQPWAGYGGAWGVDAGNAIATGPLGPGLCTGKVGRIAQPSTDTRMHAPRDRSVH